MNGSLCEYTDLASLRALDALFIFSSWPSAFYMRYKNTYLITVMFLCMMGKKHPFLLVLVKCASVPSGAPKKTMPASNFTINSGALRFSKGHVHPSHVCQPRVYTHLTRFSPLFSSVHAKRSINTSLSLAYTLMRL